MALVIVLSIVNAVTLTILDRRREIGMLRAVGFKVTTVMRLYMLESALLATASLAFGALVGYLAMEFVNGLDLRYQPPGISSPIPLLLVPNIWISLWLSLVVFTLVMTSTFVAAFRSFRQPILYLMESGNR
jgi:putative ABC transport system permease protein